MSHHNDLCLFPELRVIGLERFAHTWSERFPFVKSISLYHAHVPFEGFDFCVKYVIFFELTGVSKIDNEKFGALLAGSNALIQLGEPRPSDFKAVYQKTPNNDFINEWGFVTKLPEGAVDKFSWVLFSDEENQFSPSSEPFNENFNTAILTENTNGISEKRDNYCFKNTGDYWEVMYKGEKANIRNRERIRYIIHLLDNPGEEFSCQRLSSLVKGNEPSAYKRYTKYSEEQLQEEGLTQDEILTDEISEEFKEIKKKVLKLWEVFITSPDDEQARSNWENGKDSVQKVYGIIINDSGKKLKFFKKDKLKKEAENARSNISKLISAAIKDFEERLPSLAKHLDKEIDKGIICTYPHNKDNQIDWNIKW